MSHSLKYTGIGVEALLDAAKYDPPTADLVKALADALSESLVEWQEEISAMQVEVDNALDERDALQSEVYKLEELNNQLEDQIDELEETKTGDTE